MKRIMIDVPEKYEKLTRDFAEVLRGLEHNKVEITGVFVGTPKAERLAIGGHALSDLKAWLLHEPNCTDAGDDQSERFLLSFMREFVDRTPPPPGKSKKNRKDAAAGKDSEKSQ